MAKRYCGKLIINIKYVGGTGGDEYAGSVSLRTDGKLWTYDLTGLRCAPIGFGSGIAYDSSKAYDKMAEAAVSFACSVSGDDDAARETARERASAMEYAMEIDARGEPLISRRPPYQVKPD
jgi:hypothetical protein